jgi:MbtH protein
VWRPTRGTTRNDGRRDMDHYDSFTVVRNGEEQYSIWPSAREVPDGWHEVGMVGTRETCLAHIEEVWTDMRPRSLREFMAAQSE